MKESKKIGILLFLYSRGELSPAEQEELQVWRKQRPENEKLFIELTDPDSLRTMMQGFYQERDLGFEKLKSSFPYLSDEKLSGSMAAMDNGDPGIPVLENDGPHERSGNAPVAPQRSPAEYWGSMLSEIDETDDEEEIKPENRVIPMTPGSGKPRVKRKGRGFRIFLRVACIFVAVIVVDFFFSDSKFKNYRAEMFSPDGVKTILDDFHRGLLAGWAGVGFTKTDKGEPVYIVRNDTLADKDDFYTIKTPVAGQFILQFPNGTRVWLNAATTIKYPANFDRDTVPVEVQGEAYFEMATDTNRHFIISPSFESANQDHRSSVIRHPSSFLGQPSSRLNINTYGGDGELLITLILGNVNTAPETAEHRFQLNGGQQALFMNDTLTLTRNVDPAEIIAWKNGEFYFKEASLQNMMPAISRWYDVDIEFVTRISDKKFSLHIPRSEPISVVLDSLKKQGLHYTRIGKAVTIWK